MGIVTSIPVLRKLKRKTRKKMRKSKKFTATKEIAMTIKKKIKVTTSQNSCIDMTRMEKLFP